MSFKNRINALDDLVHAHRTLNPDVPNAALWVKENILKADLSTAERNMADLEEADLIAKKSKQISDLYDVMVSEVYSEMEKVFGTKNDVSANADFGTWQRMIASPMTYLGYDNLDTEAEIIEYANQKLLAADAFGKFRLEKLRAFRIQKESILAG